MLLNVTSYGQLGNRLQLFAHFIAFGIENNVKIANLGFKEYAHLFTNTQNDVFCRYPIHNSLFKSESQRNFIYKLGNYLVRKSYLTKLPNSLTNIVQCYPYVNNNNEFRLDNKEFLKSIKNTKIIITNGYYFVDYLNLLKHAEKIRQFFKPLKAIEENVKNLIQSARKNCDLLIGMHIRRGDYQNFQGGKYYYDTNVFVRLMSQAEGLFPNKKISFLICSDESINKSDFTHFKTISSSKHIIEDMYSLAECDYIIGTPSTYSRWACFYGNTPIYHIIDPTEDLNKDKFKTYEDIVQYHMQTAPQFPKQ